MRRAWVLLIVLLTAGLLVASFLAAGRGTLAEPRRACEPSGDLVLEFGPFQHWQGVRSVEVFMKNAGEGPRTVLVTQWEADAYRVRWDGRLVPLPTQSTHLDYVEGYEGERLAPGQRHSIGHYQIANELAGNVLLVAFADAACGSGLGEVG